MREEDIETIQLEQRATITERDLESAFQGCDDVFWAKALEYFPEVKTGDTDPMATMTYSETVKGFMKHWLQMNAQIMVDGITQEEANTLAEHVVEAQFNYSGNEGDYLIATDDSPDPMTVKVVEIEHNGNPQGFAVQVGDPAAGTTKIARSEWELEYAIEEATEAIKGRGGK